MFEIMPFRTPPQRSGLPVHTKPPDKVAYISLPTSFSLLSGGRLLNLFSSKPNKSSPEIPSRPVISYPQPLPSHIPVRPKRDFREVSAEENDPLPSSPRPRSRLKLDSNLSVASTDTIYSPEPKLHTPPKRGQPPRPLKSALKKSASENDALPPSSLTQGRTPLGDAFLFSRTRRGLPKSTLTTAKPKAGVTSRIRPSSWMPVPSRNHGTAALLDVGGGSPSHVKPNSPRQKKTVAFVDAEDQTRSPQPKRTTSRDRSEPTDHWEYIAMELDNPTSPPASPPRKREDSWKSQSTAVTTARPGSPTLTRGQVLTPIADFDTLLGQQAPPPPPMAPFEFTPARLFVGDIADEVVKDFAREMNNRSPPVKAYPTRHLRSGLPGVLQRININIVPNECHSIVWDASERDTYAWGGTLVVRDTKPASYFYPRHSIQSIHIEFHTAAEPRSTYPSNTSPRLVSRFTYEWRTSHIGQRLRRQDILERLDAERGISVEPEYVFVKPDDPDGPCAWLVHFWVPVPLRLFARSEHRTFECRAKVTVGDWETPRTEVPAGCVAVSIESLKSKKLLAFDDAAAGDATRS